MTRDLHRGLKAARAKLFPSLMSTDDEDDQAVTYVPETPLSSESGQTPLSSGSGGSTSVEDVIEVHFVGVSFEYTIPHFPCISFPLRQIKFKPFVCSIQT